MCCLPLAVAAWTSLALAVAAAGPLEVVDDWRTVGTIATGEEPRPRAVLSPRAAEQLVASIGARRHWPGPPVRTDAQAKLVENLVRLFRDPGHPEGPRGVAPDDALAANRETVRRIVVLGVLPAGARRILLIEANAFFDELGDCFTPVTYAIVFGSEGGVGEAAVLSWGQGDAGAAFQRLFEVRRDGLTLTDVFTSEGTLCAADDPAVRDLCFFREGEAFDLALGADGRFREHGRRKINSSGHFRDAASGQELRVEDGHDGAPRIALRLRDRDAWSRLELLEPRPAPRTLRAKLPGSSTTLLLAFDLAAGAGAKVTLRGSDGRRPQVFRYVRPQDRRE